MKKCQRPDDYPAAATKTEEIAGWAEASWARGHACADLNDELQKYVKG